MGYLDQLAAAARNRTTYRAGLLQAKAYRALKARTNSSLSEIESGVSSIHWALLGLLHDNPAGMRPSEAAEELGVEPAFVTAMVNDLSEKKFVESMPDKDDSRAKRLAITKKGASFVSKTEKKLLSAMRPLLKGLSIAEIAAYLAVLEKIIENAQ